MHNVSLLNPGKSITPSSSKLKARGTAQEEKENEINTPTIRLWWLQLACNYGLENRASTADTPGKLETHHSHNMARDVCELYMSHLISLKPKNYHGMQGRKCWIGGWKSKIFSDLPRGVIKLSRMMENYSWLILIKSIGHRLFTKNASKRQLHT